MGRKRQPKQRELFLPKPPRGEAHERSGRDERPPATFGHERPTTPERFFHRERRCLTSRTALVRIRMPGGVGGRESRGSPLSR